MVSKQRREEIKEVLMDLGFKAIEKMLMIILIIIGSITVLSVEEGSGLIGASIAVSGITTMIMGACLLCNIKVNR